MSIYCPGPGLHRVVPPHSPTARLLRACWGLSDICSSAVQVDDAIARGLASLMQACSRRRARACMTPANWLHGVANHPRNTCALFTAVTQRVPRPIPE